MTNCEFLISTNEVEPWLLACDQLLMRYLNELKGLTEMHFEVINCVIEHLMEIENGFIIRFWKLFKKSTNISFAAKLVGNRNDYKFSKNEVRKYK